MKYVVIYERALGADDIVGPFDTAEAAEAYGDKNHSAFQVWHVAELRAPE